MGVGRAGGALRQSGDGWSRRPVQGAV